MKISIIGGGIIGLCTAFYLTEQGHEITIIDKSDGNHGCSFGNAGYISPSHFVPLASPGIVAKGLKWMLDKSSPFYIKPRIDMDLIKWGLTFWKNSTQKNVDFGSKFLNQYLHYSREKTIELSSSLQNEFDLKLDGCYMMFRTEKSMHHEIAGAEEAKHFGIETKYLNQKELTELEPDLGITALGAIYYPIDAILDPIKLMSSLKAYLSKNNVKFIYNTEVSSITKKGNKITGLILNGQDELICDYAVLATGSWMPKLLKEIGINLLLQPGKGYSIMYHNLKNNLSKPAILIDDRVALSPYGKSLRIGGTMELSGYNNQIMMSRVKGIVNAVNLNFSELKLDIPQQDKVWYGFRPVSPDGMPYIGKPSNITNLAIAGGHSMLGISLGAGTGKIMADIVNDIKPEIDISAYRIERYV